MSDMFFDTDSFDFNSITDVIGLNDQKHTEQSHHTQTNNNEPVDDISDLIGEISRSQEPQEQDYNVDSSDLNRAPDPADAIRITDYFNSAPDDAILAVGAFEGTKAELAQKITKLERVEKDHEYFGNSRELIESGEDAILKRGFMGKIAIEQNIEMLNRRLNQNLTDNEWRQTKQDLDMANAALLNLHNDVNQSWATHQRNAQIANYNRMYIADTKLSEEVPNWDKLQPAVLEHMKKSGIPESVIEKIYDVGVAKSMLNAMLYERNKSKVAEALKRNTPANPKSVSGANQSTRNAKPGDIDAAKKAQALKKMGGSRQDNVNAFAFIKD